MQDADFRIRYFSPLREVELCGHATIAAAMALHARGRLATAALGGMFRLKTNAGILPIRIEAGAQGERRVVMAQAPSQFESFEGDVGQVAHALGVTVDDLHPALPVMYGSTGRWTLVVPVRGLEAMRCMIPRPHTFGGSARSVAAPFLPGMRKRRGSDACTAFFIAHLRDGGDPVTGTASGVLGAYYRRFIDTSDELQQSLVIEQGYEIGREGRVLVWAEKNSVGYDVRIAGTACFVEERTH